jgi:hypothetical protein
MRERAPENHCQGSEWSSGGHAGQYQLILPNLDVDGLAYEEIRLFKPMPFEKDQRNLRNRLFRITDPPRVWAVVVSGSDFELAVLHGDSLCNFHVAVEVAAGRVKTAQGTAPAISCEQVFYSLGLPTIDPELRAKRNRKLSGCGFARLVEFSRSANNFTLECWCVNRQKHSLLAVRKRSL